MPVKERPILFSAPMVRAIIAGEKTQDRRIVKPQPHTVPETRAAMIGGGVARIGVLAHAGIGDDWRCPYGKTGDRLWVREAWRTGNTLDKQDATGIARLAADAEFEPGCPIKYEADGAISRFGDNDEEDFGPWGRYRHARFMPRWASRITLEITGVRVERLQDISEDDADAEGVGLHLPRCTFYGTQHDGYRPVYDSGGACVDAYGCGCGDYSPVETFQAIWECMNGTESWDASPYVWVVEFRRITA